MQRSPVESKAHSLALLSKQLGNLGMPMWNYDHMRTVPPADVSEWFKVASEADATLLRLRFHTSDQGPDQVRGRKCIKCCGMADLFTVDVD
eukprot:23236-Pyramimonas_sp.AAC.1